MIKEVDLGNKKVSLIGTAHISQKSREEVKNAIRELKPDLVGVELDQERFNSLENKSGWKNLDLAEAIKQGKGSLLFFNLLLAVYQRKLGLGENDQEPGQEMLDAVQTAQDEGIKYSLIDREISETLQRLRENMSFWEKFKLLSALLFEKKDINLDDFKEVNILDQIISDLKEEFPSFNKILLEERNDYMAHKLLEQDFEHAVVVVGAAHLEGLERRLKNGNQKSVEYKQSRNIPWLKIFRYGFPLLVVSMLGYSFYRIGFSAGISLTKIWILSNGILAMVGAILARSHLSTWIISFLAAPLTSIDPALGAGMVSSYFEGKFYPPKVEELESIAYIKRYRDLWGNQAGRIILTFIFVTLGSFIGTVIGAGYIFSFITWL